MRTPNRFLLQPLTAAIVTAFGGGVAAQTEGAPQRVEIVVTTPVPGLGVPRDQVPSAVQSARADELARSQALDLASFLSTRLGSVHLNEVQGNPFQPDLNFRGFTASPLLGTPQGLSVYLDGVRMNQPFGDVASWDLIPRSAIGSITLMPGSNPLFGLNTLGGALSVQTKDGRTYPGSSVQFSGGSHARAALEFETGTSRADGWHAFVTGQRFHERGWRASSPSDVGQLFAKLGRSGERGSFTLTAALADNTLVGNGMQEERQLARDRSSVLTTPDRTTQRAHLLNLSAQQQLDAGWSVSGQAFHRRIRTSTLNGDVNEASFDQALYLSATSAAERAALTGAGYTGLPTVTENASNTPFPRWRCIAQALLARNDPQNGEPGEKCTGVLNTTRTDQTHSGLAAELEWQGRLAGLAHRGVVGAALDRSRVSFQQGSELGYVNADRSVTGVGAFGDGLTGGNIDGEPYDTRVDLSARTTTWSVFGTDTLALDPRTHLTLSARLDRSQVRTRDALVPGGGPGSLDGDHVFRRLNPAVGLTFAATPSLTAYGGISQGSRAPSAIELGCADPANPCKLPNAFAGDPPLRQVVTTSIEAGLRGRGAGGLQWNVGLFRADNRDDILFVADDAAGFGYFRNFGHTRRQGLEAGLQMRVGPATVAAQYSWIDATYRSHETVGGAGNSTNDSADGKGFEGNIDIEPGHRIPLIPRQLFKVSVDLPLPAGWSVGADLNAVGGSFARGNENNAHQPDGTYYLGSGRSPGYALVNLQAAWQATPSLRLFAQVHNAFDRAYTTAAQLGATSMDAQGRIVGRPFATPVNADGARPVLHSTFYAPGAPRALFLGVRVSL